MCSGQVTATPHGDLVITNLAPTAWPQVTWKTDVQLLSLHSTRSPRRRQYVHFNKHITINFTLFIVFHRDIPNTSCVLWVFNFLGYCKITFKFSCNISNYHFEFAHCTVYCVSDCFSIFFVCMHLFTMLGLSSLCNMFRSSVRKSVQ